MKFKTILLCLFFMSTGSCYANNIDAITGLIKRILPKQYHQFEIVYSAANSGKDHYGIESRNGKIILKGNNNVSIATAFNHYLKNYCNASVSWTGNQLSVPKILPVVSKTITRDSPFEHRLYFNYCTFNYTMSFWGWERWEQEIDWMALHGINLPLAMVGQEAVWQNTLRKIGYTDQEIKAFISGPAYTGWWLMGNLEGWGGPVSQSWIDEQSQLQKKIVNRMRELGMQPVLQGFYGMVPNSLIKKFPSANIHDPGLWCGFKRPAMLIPTDSLFSTLAKTYYEEQEKLYGRTNYYQGDPFHEGGSSEGVDLSSAGSAIFKSMATQNPNAVWVLQAWQINPKKELLQDVPKERVLITDLNAEARPQWGGLTKHLWDRKEGFAGHNWIWSIIPNFGGRTGMTGKLDSMAIDIHHALHHPIGEKTMKGIGAAPEAIEQDAVLYDLLFDAAWSSEKLNVDAWLKDYVKSRYGKYDDTIMQVWSILRKTVYRSTYGEKDPPIESILCARPGWNKTSSSSWGEWKLDYDASQLVAAWKLSMKAIPAHKNSDAFQYDMVNLTRQVFANYARVLYDEIEKANKVKNIAAYTKCVNLFLALIKDQDHLLSSRKEFMLGPWLEMAKSRAHTAQDKKLYEFNARALITIWSGKLDPVNDYSCREWSGLLRDYYQVRWIMFFDENLKQLNGEKPTELNFFEFEKKWALENRSYPKKAVIQSMDIVQKLFKKYENIIK